MADEQGPVEEKSRHPGGRPIGRGAAVRDLMAKGTVSSEIRVEMRRAMGMCKALGIRLERHMNLCPLEDTPTEGVITKLLNYTLILGRLCDAQAKLEREARLRLQGLSGEQISARVQELMESQIEHLIVESMRGSKGRDRNLVGA